MEPRGGPSKLLRVLIIDDSESDAELSLFELEKAGYDVDHRRVQTASELTRVLGEKDFDCIICDHKMPGFSSEEALEIVKSLKGGDVPFLIVSGIIGEDTAVAAMKQGAHDYIMKSNLTRLVPAIEREMREAKIRRENRESLERLRESEKRFRSMAEAAPIMIWMCDNKMKCNYINRRLLAFLGETPGSNMCPLLWAGHVHPEDYGRVAGAFMQAFQAQEDFMIEYRMKRADGEWRTLVDTAVPRFNGMGRFEGFIGSSVDFTDQIRARQEAEQANIAKSRFLANMSHEIRTPLGAILGFADLLREDDLEKEEKSHYLDIIMRNGNELLRIIGDILDLSKIEAGKIAVEISTFRLQELISEVISLLELKAKEKGLELSARIEPSTPTWVQSDRTRLRQILINIIGNSIKFTTEGRVSLLVEGFPASPENTESVKFTVDDTGPGITAEKRGQLFQPFSQGDDSTTRAFGGTGLGLVLSRHMARALGGDVVLVEKPGGIGSRFEIWIATSYATEAKAVLSESMREGKTIESGKALPLDGVHILLVEDVKDNRILVKSLLEKNGARVETAENGEEGVHKALGDDFALVLMDLHMPGLDGYKATQILRAQGFMRPIVALTAHAMKDERERYLQAGFSRYLTKPLNLGELINTVSELSH